MTAEPEITDHPFDPYTYGDMVFCIHVDNGATQCCGKAEDQHKPAAVDEAVCTSSDT